MVGVRSGVTNTNRSQALTSFVVPLALLFNLPRPLTVTKTLPRKLVTVAGIEFFGNGKSLTWHP